MYMHFLIKRTSILALLIICSTCKTTIKPSSSAKCKTVTILTTAYCPCQKCCGWKRNWYGRPVFAYGNLKGKPKKVGICADGTKAKKGTIAADTRYYPFGTVFYVPGYGYGKVHDRGGKIKGLTHIDLYFNSHQKALNWGRKTLKVNIYR